MFLFSAALAVQWYYPGDTFARVWMGTFMLMVTLLVAWCTWTARDRSDLWWFQPDPDRTGHGEFDIQQGNMVSFGIHWLGRLCRSTTSFIQKLMMSQSASGENRATQQAPHDAAYPRSSASESKLWANSHAS